jgi:hypothetical protein
MAFIIPNATDTGPGLKFVNINQAEPDSLDIEVLGNRSSGIRSGGAVTQVAGTITVASGVAIIKGVPYSFNGTTLTNSAPVNSAFTLILVRLNTNTGVASITTLNGPDSANNPTLPKSRSTALIFSPVTDFDPETDVSLATVFRAAPTSTLDGHIVDKRVVISGSLQWTQATAPLNTQGEGGDIVTVGPKVYLKTAGVWQPQVSQSDVDEIVPVGGVIIWPANTNPPARYLECNGQVVNSTSYPALASAWSLTGAFALPNYQDVFLRGGAVSGASGVNTGSGGDNTAAVPLKSHSHGMQNHTHGIGPHTHTATVAPDAGAHSHSGEVSNGTVTVDSAGAHAHTVSSANYSTGAPGYANFVGVAGYVKGSLNGGFTFALSNRLPFTGNIVPTDERCEVIRLGGGTVNFEPNIGTDTLITLPAGAHAHTAALANRNVSISGQGTHNHSVSISTAEGASSSSPSNNTTTTEGDSSNPSISTVPAFRTVRYFVRAY